MDEPAVLAVGPAVRKPWARVGPEKAHQDARQNQNCESQRLCPGVHVSSLDPSTHSRRSVTTAVNDQELTFNIQVNSGYHRRGEYPVGSILDAGRNLRLQVGSFMASSTTGGGTLAVNKDQKSGTLDSDLSGGEHVK
ncbi:MAG: hypothetical protein E6H83_09365 [Chloroflexi bacterium]|nr:MAG: hypothetical protein E6H83_09365 [Chloroflexota bacterium]